MDSGGGVEQMHIKDRPQVHSVGETVHALGNEPARMYRDERKSLRTHCSFGYTASASFRMGMLGCLSHDSGSSLDGMFRWS